MPYLVQFGSLTVVARSPSQALRLRKQFLDDQSDDVMIADMDGFPVDVDQLQQVVTADEEEAINWSSGRKDNTP